MAKSTRSKVKRAFRSKKREEGVYAATEAARLQRLNLKLQQTLKKDADGDVEIDEAEGSSEDSALAVPTAENQPVDSAFMQADSGPQTSRISTHGPRGSRREEWRKSKGLTPRPVARGMNRQGSVAGKRKAGRSKRRR